MKYLWLISSLIWWITGLVGKFKYELPMHDSNVSGMLCFIIYMLYGLEENK